MNYTEGRFLIEAHQWGFLDDGQLDTETSQGSKRCQTKYGFKTIQFKFPTFRFMNVTILGFQFC